MTTAFLLLRNVARSMTSVSVLAISLLVFLFPFASDAATITAKALLQKVAVQAENGPGYQRSAFPLWVDADKDKCDTRAEILIIESKTKPVLGPKCKVISGKWYSWYDGKTWTKPADVDIDHVVPLKEAWESGAKSWTKEKRTRYANDLAFAWGLDAVTDNVNSSKSDKDPAQWMPPLKTVYCSYATHWVAVKYRWKLTIDPAEFKKLASVLTGSCGSQVLSLPQQAK